MRTLLLVATGLLALAGCSSTSSPADAGGNDAPVADTGTPDVPVVDLGADVPVADTGTPDLPAVDTGRDVPVADTGADTGTDAGTADVQACGPGRACTPYFCGCGRCDPALITCVSDGRSCPLACPIACPELATTTCSCTDGACRVASTGADAGGAAGTECSSTGDCAAGLVCCYPCGIPGCHNQCTEPDSSGMCPLHP